MGKIRYVHGWECPSCYDLYITEKKALNCFKGCLEDCENKKKEKKLKVVLVKGHECINCLKIYEKSFDAEKCCIVPWEQETERKDTYDVIGKHKRRLIKLKENK